MKVLITGVSGRLGQLVARRLLYSGKTVIGIDHRPWPEAPPELCLFRTDLRKRKAEDVVRSERPDAIVHLATVAHLRSPAWERHRINLQGTKAVFDYSARYDVKHTIFVGRHTYYGAAPDSPLYHTENDPPMAIESYPELADLVAADLFAGSALWRFPTLHTAVLRLCYTLGPSKHGTLGEFLSGKRVPVILGYDPLFQVMHEDDSADAILCALQKQARGVFNVAGPSPLPLLDVIRLAGRQPLRVPGPLYPHLVGRFGLRWLPERALNHLKYPVVIDDQSFRSLTGFRHKHGHEAIFEAFRQASETGSAAKQ